MRAAFLLVICLCTTELAVAQPGAAHNFLFWVDPSLNYQLSSQTRVSADFFNRTRLNDFGWHQMVLRLGIAHTFSERVSVLGGVGWFRIKDHALPARNEIRYWGGLQYTHPLFRRIELQHYLRLEERAFYQQHFANEFSFRLRYRLGVHYMLKQREGKSGTLLMLQHEPFLTVNPGPLKQQFFSFERVAVGVGHSFSPKLRLDVSYMLQWGKIFKEDPFDFGDYILQLRIQYTINAQ